MIMPVKLKGKIFSRMDMRSSKTDLDNNQLVLMNHTCTTEILKTY